METTRKVYGFRFRASQLKIGVRVFDLGFRAWALRDSGAFGHPIPQHQDPTIVT